MSIPFAPRSKVRIPADCNVTGVVLAAWQDLRWVLLDEISGLDDDERIPFTYHVDDLEVA